MGRLDANRNADKLGLSDLTLVFTRTIVVRFSNPVVTNLLIFSNNDEQHYQKLLKHIKYLLCTFVIVFCFIIANVRTICERCRCHLYHKSSNLWQLNCIGCFWKAVPDQPYWLHMS